MDGDHRSLLSKSTCIVAALLSPEVCAQTPFTEEATSRGLVFFTPQAANTFGAGIGFTDLDNDGDPDLVAVGSADRRVRLWTNDGTGHFTDHGPLPGIPARLFNGVSFCDYDRDGDMDIMLSAYAAQATLLRNNGEWRFTDVTAVAGVGNYGAGQGMSWGDYNGDGWMDLYLCNRTNAPAALPRDNRLYRNNGNGTFTDVAAALGVSDPGAPSFQCAFLDVDRDGDADLYVAEDKGALDCAHHNKLWRNDGGSFTDVSQECGAGECMDGMCVTVGDYDCNGLVDIFVTNTQFGNKMFLAQPAGQFVERAESIGVASYLVGWGSQFLDFDNDGRLDLFVCNDFGPNRLYRQNPDGSASDIAELMGVDAGGTVSCCAVADIDDDGDLDIAVSSEGLPLRLFVNHADQNRRWTKLRIVSQSPGSLIDAVGAVVDVTYSDREQTAQVVSTSGFKSANPFILHFGLGDGARFVPIERITVVWPGESELRTLYGYASNETWTIYPFNRLGDKNLDGRIALDDLFEMLNCWFGTTARNFVPGCEMMDFDGDAAATVQDIYMFLDRFFAR